MRLALKIVAAALSVLAIVTGIVFTIPQSRACYKHFSWKKVKFMKNN